MSKGARIAVLDDEPVTRKMLTKLLERQQYVVESFADDASFLKGLEGGGFELILLDVVLEGQATGIDICKLIRQRYPINELPVLMVTAHSDDQIFIESLDAGANDFISKPIQPAKLLARVQTQLKMSKASKELIAAQSRMSAQQRLEALGIFAMGVAHNLNNSLGIIHGSAEMIKRAAANDPKQQRLADMVLDASKRSSALIANLSVLSSSTVLEGHCNAVHVCQATVDLVRSLVRNRIALDVHASAPEILAGLPAPEFATVMTYVVKNALDSIAGTGSVSITVQNERPGWMQVLVHDSGPPLSADIQHRLFEPFFSRSGEHDRLLCSGDRLIGLGLWSAWQIVNHAGGELSISDSTERGTTVNVLLPEGNAQRDSQESSLSG